ncbi:hypothetical protein BV20DRAFT_963737 [Pilatotrama ljubarskyi]|nr:hypothetical protein BV20DRAFT_963737 [Pilatotrama ljubarskyi]
MRYSFITFAAALLGQAAVATPLADVDAPSIAASLPVSKLFISAAHVRSNITAPQSKALHPIVKRQEFPATLLLCTLQNCASGCRQVDIASVTQNECELVSVFFSAAIVQPSNEGLPFGVDVGPNPCLSLSQIPTVNECFNLHGALFNAFDLIP